MWARKRKEGVEPGLKLLDFLHSLLIGNHDPDLTRVDNPSVLDHRFPSDQRKLHPHPKKLHHH